MTNVSTITRRASSARKLAAAVVAAAVAVTLTSCSRAPGHVSGPSAPSISYQPGTPVAPASVTSAGQVAYQARAVLYGNNAYIGENGKIDIVDLAAKPIASIGTRTPPLRTDKSSQSSGAPMLTSTGGAPLVLWPSLVAAAGGPVSVELISVHTDTHAADHVMVKLPDAFTPTQPSSTSVAVIGTEGPTVVLLVNDLLRNVTMAVDQASGRTLWSRSDFAATAVADHTVVGIQHDPQQPQLTQASGIDVSTGRPAWTQPPGINTHLMSAGPALVVATAEPAKPAPNTAGVTQVLAAKTGAVVSTLPLTPAGGMRCLYDQASVAVCSSPADPRSGGRAVVAFDARTGHTLWSMPNKKSDSGEVPLVTAAWHGQIYTVETDAPLLPENTTTVTNGRTANVALPSEEPSSVYQSRSGATAGYITGAVPVAVNDQGCLAVNRRQAQLLVRPSVSPAPTQR